MSIRTWAAAAVFAAAAIAAAAPNADAARSATRSVVSGRMTAVATGGAERGTFRLATLDRGNGAHVERIDATARNLNVTGATAASPPSFHIFLIKSDGTGAADFGAMRVNHHGSAGFVFDTRRASNTLPSGVTSVTDFSGGTIEVRDGTGTAVCHGTIPAFGGGGTSGSRVFGRAESRLTSTSTSFHGTGSITARRQSLPRGVHEELTISCSRMANATTYTAVAIDASSNETTLSSFTTSNPRGLGGFRLVDSNIPGGGVLSLAGQTVEIRDSTNTAVLTGTFPTIP